MAVQGHDVAGVGQDVADHLVAAGGVGGIGADGGDEGRVLQRHDGGVGDHALLQLVLLGMGADAQGRAHRGSVREGRTDGARVAHIGGVGAGLAHDIVGQHRRADRQFGLDGRLTLDGRRLFLLLLAEREGGGGA